MMKPQIDYKKEYDLYWSDPARWGGNSFKDPNQIVENLLKTCGRGYYLDVGCGMGNIVKEFCKRGIDAYGVDAASRTVEHNNVEVPNHFYCASILELPFDDNSFDTVITTDVLEHIQAEDIDAALRELYRVTRKNLYVRLSMREDIARRWHLTIQDKSWWEKKFFAAGFQRHDLYAEISGFGDTDFTTAQFAALYQKNSSAVEDEGLLVPAPKTDLFWSRCHVLSEYIQNGDNVLMDCVGEKQYKHILRSYCKMNLLQCMDDDAAEVQSIDFLITDDWEIWNKDYFARLDQGCRIAFLMYYATNAIPKAELLRAGIFIERLWIRNVPNNTTWRLVKDYLIPCSTERLNDKGIDVLVARKEPITAKKHLHKDNEGNITGLLQKLKRLFVRGDA